MNTFLRSIVTCSSIFLLGCTTGKASNLNDQGPFDKIRLEPCPETPNCVSSYEPVGDKHHIAPLRYTGEKDFAYQNLMVLIESSPGARIVDKQSNYIKAEFKSAIFRFVDDVAFLFSSDQSVIEVRSASRVGYYDFGKNRRRIEDIRKRWDTGLNH